MTGFELALPETIVKIERIGKHAFSYFRQDSEGKITEKCNCLEFCSEISKTFQGIMVKIQFLHSAYLLYAHYYLVSSCTVI